MKIDGAVIIVTGSATGVGAACVKQFAEGGARVVVNYSRSKKEADETGDICRSLGAEVEIVQADVADDAACRRMVATAVNRWGRLDALVNNAAMTVKSDPFDLETLSAEDFQSVFGVNVIGAIRCAGRRCLPCVTVGAARSSMSHPTLPLPAAAVRLPTRPPRARSMH